jgi:hypothetical protein
MFIKRSIGVIFAAAFALSAFAQATPQVTLVDPIKDFGTVAKGDKLDHAFSIRNTGTADLQILAVRPTCGCTVAEFDKVIKPGEVGKVVAHVDTTQFSGPISKAVIIETNDISTPNAQVTVRAVVKPFVEAFPAGFLRFNMVQGDTAAQSVVIYSEEEAPFEIVRADVPGEHVKVEFKKAVGEEIVKAGRPNQAQYIATVTYGGPSAKLGPIAEKIRIVTNSTHQPEYVLNISGVVRPSYSVVPTVLNFGEVGLNDAAAERSITLRSNDLKAPGAFKVTRVESSAGVLAEAKPTETPGEYQVIVKLAKDAKAGALDGNLRIHTSDIANPVYNVPVKALVKAGGSTGSSR